MKVGDLVKTLTREEAAPVGTQGIVTEITQYSSHVTLVRVQLMFEPSSSLKFVKRDLKVVSNAE